MKKIFILLLLFILSSYGESFSADYVWGKTKWGMNISQVNNAVGKKFTFNQKNKKGEDVYILDGHKIGNNFYDIHAVFGPGGLSQILIMKKGTPLEIKDICSYISVDISARAEIKDTMAGPGANIRNWKTKDSNISLLCLDSELFLDYSKIKNDGTSNF